MAPLVAWMAYAPQQQNWSPTEDLGALLHGFLTRFGTLFDTSKQCVNIGEVSQMAFHAPSTSLRWLDLMNGLHSPAAELKPH